MDALTAIRESLADIYTPEGVEIWLHGRHRLLDGRVPIDLINEGNEEPVLAIIEQLHSGAFV